MENEMETNSIQLLGNVLDDLRFSHKSYGESFYAFTLGVHRKSGYQDQIQMVVSERLIWDMEVPPGSRVWISGQIRTYNENLEGRNKLNVVVFAREFALWKEGERGDENQAELAGFLCKKPVRRMSPLGREICDLMLAVNRMYNKSDYVPCIAWGRNAAYAGGLSVGDRIHITGRIQSREYRKKDEEGNVTVKIAYEVSVLKIEE